MRIFRLFELESGGEGRLQSMEGLRGFAISLVFFVHYSTLIEPWISIGSFTEYLSHGLRGIGNTGVDLFFVLSGYLIYGHLIARPRALAAYFRRRIQRIYPTFLTVFAIYVGLSFALPGRSKILGGAEAFYYIIANLLFLPGVFPIEPMITVAWSLSYEVAYYIVTPLVILALNMRSWQIHQRVAFLLGVALVGTIWQHYEGGDLRWIMFLSGAVLFETADILTGRLPSIAAPLALILSLGAIWLLHDVGGSGPVRVWLLFIGFYVLCLGCFTGRETAAEIFSWAPLRMLGNMSYSYYLVHALALNAIFFVLGEVYPQTGDATVLYWALLVPAFSASVISAGILFLLIEKPLSLVPGRIATAMPRLRV